jgi:branched-chain amino acid transport system permease protein
MFSQLLLNGIIIGSTYSIVGMGFSTNYRAIKFFNFFHGTICTIAAYIMFTLMGYIGYIPAFISSILLSGFIGVMTNQLVYKKLRKQGASSLVLLIASFGTAIFFQNFIQIVYGSQPVSLGINEISKGNQILDVIITNNQIIIVISTLIISLALIFLNQRTKLGKSMRAVADNPIAASIVGIDTESVIANSFFISSILAGIAGILISLEANVDPIMGFSIILKGIIASIIGGVGNIYGALIGGIFLGIIENLGVYWIDAGWKDGITFSVFLIFLFFKPNGILDIFNEKERL